jgi:hypothetical protein
MTEISHTENRRHVRFYCAGSAEVYLTPEGEPQAANVGDLSIEGALLIFEKEQRINRGTILELAFSVNNLPFRVRGEVMVVRSPTTLGLRFALLSHRVRFQLVDLIEELTESHHKRAANKVKTEKMRKTTLAGQQ